MSELSYKELQEQGVFDVPYRAFEFMQSQQAKIDAITKQRDSFIKAHHIAMNDVCEHKAKIDELQARIDETLIEMKNQLGDEDFCDMQRPDYDAMLYALRNIKDILKGK